MGVADLLREFDAADIVTFEAPADYIFVDGCIYWEYILPKEAEIEQQSDTDDIKRTTCLQFLNYIFKKLLKKEGNLINSSVKIIFDSRSCRPWLKWSKCIQRMRQQENIKSKKMRFHPSCAEFNELWEKELKPDYPGVNVCFEEAPRDTDSLILLECQRLLSNGSSRSRPVQIRCPETHATVEDVCSNICIYSGDSDFVSFFPFMNLVCICHLEMWLQESQIVRLLNYKCRNTHFWTSIEQFDLHKQFDSTFDIDALKLSLFKTYVISKGHNDYMTCSLQPPRQETNWRALLEIIKADPLLFDKKTLDIDTTVFFNFLYYFHLDVNITPAKLRQVVGNALRLFVAEIKDTEPVDSNTHNIRWTHFEISNTVASSCNSQSKLITTMEDLLSYFSSRLIPIEDSSKKSSIEDNFKFTCNKTTEIEVVNIGSALTEWQVYFEKIFQKKVQSSRKRQRLETTLTDGSKWCVFAELNEIIFKALMHFYIGLFKVWFPRSGDGGSDKKMQTHPVLDLFLKRLEQLLFFGSDADLSLEIKERIYFQNLLCQKN